MFVGCIFAKMVHWPFVSLDDSNLQLVYRVLDAGRAECNPDVVGRVEKGKRSLAAGSELFA